MGTPRARHAAAGAIIAVVAWLAFYTGWLVAYLVPIGAAALLSAWAATRVPKGLRAFWLLVSLACASWLAGEILWSVVELGAGKAAAAGVSVWRRGDTAADVIRRAEDLLDAALRLGGNHTRGPKSDVLVNGHPRLGVTAFGQLLELAAAIDARYLVAPTHSRKVARLSRISRWRSSSSPRPSPRRTSAASCTRSGRFRSTRRRSARTAH